MKYIVPFIPLCVVCLFPSFWRFMTWQYQWASEVKADRMGLAIQTMVIVATITLVFLAVRWISRG